MARTKLIIVTGGAGHVGSHVIELLVKDPANRVISLDNYFNGSAANHIAGGNIEYRTGHTKDIAKLVPERPDIVYHLGEYARIAPSLTEPETVFDLNLTGTVGVLEFCRQRQVGKLVYAGSSTRFAVEGNGPDQNPYSFTKATNIRLIEDYVKWFKDMPPYAICYFYNAFGPREKGAGKYATVIAKFMQQYLGGTPFTIDGSGDQRRRFTYVGDIARGVILVGEQGEGDGFSLDNQKSYSIKDIAEALGGEAVFTANYSGRQDSGETPSRARDELGWDTTIDVIDYLKKFAADNPRH